MGVQEDSAHSVFTLSAPPPSPVSCSRNLGVESLFCFKSCSPDSENRRGKAYTFDWPQCFAPGGVEPRDLGGGAEAKRS